MRPILILLLPTLFVHLTAGQTTGHRSTSEYVHRTLQLSNQERVKLWKAAVTNQDNRAASHAEEIHFVMAALGVDEVPAVAALLLDESAKEGARVAALRLLCD